MLKRNTSLAVKARTKKANPASAKPGSLTNTPKMTNMLEKLRKKKPNGCMKKNPRGARISQKSRK